MNEMLELGEVQKCSATFVRAVNDTMNVMNSKWKLPILGTLVFGKRRFKELEREIPKISPRMLSRELRDLEANGMVSRTVYDTLPLMVEYELTESGRSFRKVLDVMVEWGLQHRKRTIDQP
jgi:DNA-binding HxlR family transcriptional regulator